MCEALTIGRNSRSWAKKTKSFDLSSTSKSDDYGYILEVELQYPEHLHNAHSDLPSLGRKVTNHPRYVLPILSLTFRQTHLSEKLSPNLYDKLKYYVLHYENLRFNLKLGIILGRIYRLLKFRQRSWMKPYIDFNTAKRQAAKVTVFAVPVQKCKQYGFW